MMWANIKLIFQQSIITACGGSTQCKRHGTLYVLTARKIYSQSSFKSSNISDGFALDSAVGFDITPEVFGLWVELYNYNEQPTAQIRLN